MELIAQIIIKDKHKGTTVMVAKEVPLKKIAEIEDGSVWTLECVVPVKKND